MNKCVNNHIVFANYIIRDEKAFKYIQIVIMYVCIFYASRTKGIYASAFALVTYKICLKILKILLKGICYYVHLMKTNVFSYMLYRKKFSIYLQTHLNRRKYT